METLKKHMSEEYGVALPDDATMGDFVQEYIKAKGAQVAIVHPQQMHFINLDITAFCNLKCYSCNHFIDSAVAKAKDSPLIMTLDQVKDFVEESQQLNWRWDELRLTGGEPSIHPQFKEILKVVGEGLRSYLPNVTLKIVSNGTGKKVRKILGFDEAKIFSFNKDTDSFYLDHIGHPEWQVVTSKPMKDTIKKTTIKNYDGTDLEESQLIGDFGNVWQAPIDRLDEVKNLYNGIAGDINETNAAVHRDTTQHIRKEGMDIIKRENMIMDCRIHATCGFELTPYGYTPCPCGGGRVVGDQNIFFKSLSEITLDECYKKLAKMCAVCGRNLNYNVNCDKRVEKTEFWKLVLSKFQRKSPRLELYDPFERRRS